MPAVVLDDGVTATAVETMTGAIHAVVLGAIVAEEAVTVDAVLVLVALDITNACGSLQAVSLPQRLVVE